MWNEWKRLGTMRKIVVFKHIKNKNLHLPVITQDTAQKKNCHVNPVVIMELINIWGSLGYKSL